MDFLFTVLMITRPSVVWLQINYAKLLWVSIHAKILDFVTMVDQS